MFYLFITLLLAPLIARRGGLLLPPRRILVIQTAKIGDVVMSTPVLGSLRASFPQAHIVLAHAPLTTEIVRGHPWIDAELEVQAAQLHGFTGKFLLARELRRGDFDTVLILSPSLPLLIAAVWAGIGRRLAVMPATSGTSMRVARRLLTGHVLHDGRRRIGDVQLELVRLAGGTAISDQQCLPAPSLTKDLPAFDGYANVVGVGVNAGNNLKSLDEATLAQACREIAARSGTAVALIGADADREKAARIVALAADPNIFDFTGRYALCDLPALLSKLAVFVGVDSGITHMADALGVPQIVVSGPVNIIEFMPRAHSSAIISPRDLPCAPCVFSFRTPYHCAIGTHVCVKNVDPAEICAAVESVLSAQRGGA